MILDEAHMIKNIKSERYKRLQNLNVSKSISYYLGLVLQGDWFYNFGKILEENFSEDYSFRKHSQYWHGIFLSFKGHYFYEDVCCFWVKKYSL